MSLNYNKTLYSINSNRPFNLARLKISDKLILIKLQMNINAKHTKINAICNDDVYIPAFAPP